MEIVSTSQVPCFVSKKLVSSQLSFQPVHLFWEGAWIPWRSMRAEHRNSLYLHFRSLPTWKAWMRRTEITSETKRNSFFHWRRTWTRSRRLWTVTNKSTSNWEPASNNSKRKLPTRSKHSTESRWLLIVTLYYLLVNMHSIKAFSSAERTF